MTGDLTMGMDHRICGDHVQPLEPRRLLAFATFGQEMVLRFGGLTELSEDSTALAVARSGRYLIASVAAQEGAEIARFSANGDSIGPRVNLEPEADDRLVSASMDADGDAVVAYSVVADGGDPITKVYVRRISKWGDASAPVLVEQFGEDLNGLGVSMDDGGGFYVGWLRGLGARARAYNAAGVPRGNAFAVGTGGGTSVNSFEITSKTNGSAAALAYVRVGSDSSSPILEFGQVGAAGPLDPANPIDVGATPAENAAVAVLTDGTLVLAFERRRDPGVIDLDQQSFVQRFSAAGVAQGAPIALGPAGATNGIHSPSVDATLDGGFMATFVRTTATASTTYVQRYDAQGRPDPSGPIAVHGALIAGSISENYIAPAVEIDEAGILVVLFRDLADRAVHYQRVESRFGTQQGPELFVN